MRITRLFCSSMAAVAIAGLGMATAPAHAAILYTGSGAGNNAGQTLAASATFDIMGSDLIVTLTNTAAFDPNDPPDILTALFFSIAGNPTLSRVSATLNSGSTVIHGPSPATDAGGVVGGEWTYKNGLAGAPGGATQGISSAGYGLFAPGDRFPGSNLQGPTSPDGLQYGITTLFDLAGNDNGGLAGAGLIKDSVVFDLGGLPAGFRLADLSHVSFQYGTALTEINIPGQPHDPKPPIIGSVPEPNSLLLVVTGLAMVGLYRGRQLCRCSSPGVVSHRRLN